MKRVENLKWTQFHAILRAFNAPFLEVFASVEAYMHPLAAWDIAEKACDTINERRYGQDCCNYASNLEVLEQDADTPSLNGFSFSWQTRNGNVYRFGQADGSSAYTYWVEYPNETYIDEWGDTQTPTMPPLIEYLAHGTPIPSDYFERYPYADNPYLKRRG